MGVHRPTAWFADAVFSSAQLPGGGPDPVIRADYFEMGPGHLEPTAMLEHSLLVPTGAGHVTGVYRRQGQRVDLDLWPGSMIVTPAGEISSWEWYGPVKFLLIRVHPDRIRHFVRGDLRVMATESQLDGQVVIEDEELSDWAGRMKDALEVPGPGQPVLFEALARVFLVTLVRRYVAADTAPYGEDGGLSATRYAQLLDYIDDHIGGPLRTPDLAHHLGMSDSALTRALKHSAGMTPQAVVMLRRIDAAKSLLQKPELSLGTIAMTSGFADQAHLSRSFKAAMGMTPSAFRKAKTN